MKENKNFNFNNYDLNDFDFDSYSYGFVKMSKPRGKVNTSGNKGRPNYKGHQSSERRCPAHAFAKRSPQSSR